MVLLPYSMYMKAQKKISSYSISLGVDSVVKPLSLVPSKAATKEVRLNSVAPSTGLISSMIKWALKDLFH